MATPQGGCAVGGYGRWRTDIARWSQLYQEQCPDTNFTLEIITSLPPKVLNYLEPTHWDVYMYCRRRSLLNSRNSCTMAYRILLKPLLTASWANLTPEVKKAIAQDQCTQLEKSVRYCRDVLGIGA
ncbi:MAG: hypothetical protein R2867_33320 [Caldilineaceae bacterium]